MIKHLFVTAIVLLSLFGALLGPGTIQAHTQYSSVYPTSTGQEVFYSNFYISAHTRHGIQQTYPDSRKCFHRIYVWATGEYILGIWLYGNDYKYSQSYFTIYNNSSSSVKFRHSVTGCQGQVQVYYWHSS